MSRDGHTLSWKATGVLATEHLSLERGHNTSQHICVCACVQLLSCVFLLFARRWPRMPPVLFQLSGAFNAFITVFIVKKEETWRDRLLTQLGDVTGPSQHVKIRYCIQPFSLESVNPEHLLQHVINTIPGRMSIEEKMTTVEWMHSWVFMVITYRCTLETSGVICLFNLVKGSVHRWNVVLMKTLEKEVSFKSNPRHTEWQHVFKR